MIADLDDYRRLNKEELVQRLWLAQFDSFHARSGDPVGQRIIVECMAFRRPSWFERPKRSSRHRGARKK
jgi:hypothetical protein